MSTDGRPILVCADDYGLHPVVDLAVLELAAHGRLTGASCLVDGPSFISGGPELARSGLLCGLHLNFTERLGRDGLFMSLGKLIRASWLRQLDPNAVMEQVRTQLDRFEDVMGRGPDYIDGHQHVHQFPIIRDALIQELDARHPSWACKPWIRSTLTANLNGVPVLPRVKSHVIALLGGRAMDRLTRKQGYAGNAGFLGVYGFAGAEAGYAAMLATWLKKAQAGTLIMCHPATDAVPGDPLGTQRCAEFHVWRGEIAAKLLDESGVTVATPAQAATAFVAPDRNP
jgi:Uncharacterized protein conserved in bacteria